MTCRYKKISQYTAPNPWIMNLWFATSALSQYLTSRSVPQLTHQPWAYPRSHLLPKQKIKFPRIASLIRHLWASCLFRYLESFRWPDTDSDSHPILRFVTLARGLVSKQLKWWLEFLFSSLPRNWNVLVSNIYTSGLVHLGRWYSSRQNLSRVQVLSRRLGQIHI